MAFLSSSVECEHSRPAWLRTPICNMILAQSMHVSTAQRRECVERGTIWAWPKGNETNISIHFLPFLPIISSDAYLPFFLSLSLLPPFVLYIDLHAFKHTGKSMRGKIYIVAASQITQRFPCRSPWNRRRKRGAAEDCTNWCVRLILPHPLFFLPLSRSSVKTTCTLLQSARAQIFTEGWARDARPLEGEKGRDFPYSSGKREGEESEGKNQEGVEIRLFIHYVNRCLFNCRFTTLN